LTGATDPFGLMGLRHRESGRRDALFGAGTRIDRKIPLSMTPREFFYDALGIANCDLAVG